MIGRVSDVLLSTLRNALGMTDSHNVEGREIKGDSMGETVRGHRGETWIFEPGELKAILVAAPSETMNKQMFMPLYVRTTIGDC